MAKTTTTINHHKRKRSWEKDFYKNGYPKEVIVIEDSPTPPPATCTTLPAHNALKTETNCLRTCLPPLPLVATTTDSSSSTSSHESLNTSLTQQQQQQVILEPDPKRTKYTIQPYQPHHYHQHHHQHHQLYHQPIPPLSAPQPHISSRHPSQYHPHHIPNAASTTSTTTTDNFINQSILAYHIFPNTLYSSSSPNQPPPPPLLQPPTHNRPKRVQQRPPILPPPPPQQSESTNAASTATTTPTTATKNVTEPCDDRDGHYIVRLHQSLTSQYQIVKLLGQGTFGKVVQCYDHVRRTFCAIKIIRAVPKYRDASKIEIRVLDTLKQHDPLNLNKCIHLIEWFDYQNHICMVFELLGQSVFDYLKSVQFRPFSAQQIQQLAKQLLTSVAFLHDLKLVHTDLKPENILLVRPPSTSTTRSNTSSTTSTASSSIHSLNNNYYNPVLIEDDDNEADEEGLDEEFTADIRLIDFGSATFEQDYHSAVVSTRHYRAPEIILGIGWSYPCDMWSIGCILVEFFTGDALFQTHDNLEHLCMMATVLGDIPTPMIQKASKEAQQKFFTNKRLRNYNRQQFLKKFGRTVKPLEEIVPATNMYNSYLLDLLRKLLVYEPEQRLTAREALRHPFFQI